MSTIPDAGDTLAVPIVLEGRDVLPLLHRISTQRLDDLGSGETRMTLFCDPRGGLLHRAAVARLGDLVWLLRNDAPPASLAAHLDRHVFRERVRIVEPPPGLAVRAVAGGFGILAGSVEERGGVPAQVQVEEAFGYATEDVLSGAAPISDSDAEAARILAGWPRHGFEVREAFNPYDIGRACEVHLGKGCYTGQESLLRLITYGGVRRGLARLEGDGRAPAVPAPLNAGGREVGTLTSAVARAGGWIGLAVVKLEAVESGAEFGAGADATARVADVFPQSRPSGLPGKASSRD